MMGLAFNGGNKRICKNCRKSFKRFINKKGQTSRICRECAEKRKLV